MNEEIKNGFPIPYKNWLVSPCVMWLVFHASHFEGI
jgi:hypothetical protein